MMSYTPLPKDAPLREKVGRALALLVALAFPIGFTVLFIAVSIEDDNMMSAIRAQQVNAFQGGEFAQCNADNKMLDENGDVVVSAIKCGLSGPAKTNGEPTRIYWHGSWYTNCVASAGSSRDGQSPPPAIQCFIESK